MKTNTSNIIRKWIIDNFVTDLEDHTIPEIAVGTGFSESTVRKYVWDLVGYGILVTKKEITCYSTDYPMHVSGYRQVDAFGPTRKQLVETLL